MANKLSKNAEKAGETAIIAAVSTLLTWLFNKYVLDVPPDVSASMVIVTTAVGAGLYNAITHGPFQWPWGKK